MEDPIEDFFSFEKVKGSKIEDHDHDLHSIRRNPDCK
jgi:hypothetical protein